MIFKDTFRAIYLRKVLNMYRLIQICLKNEKQNERRHEKKYDHMNMI